MEIRAARDEDAGTWERLRAALWPAAPGEHAGEIARYFAGDGRIAGQVLLALADDGAAIGFAELSIRAAAEGCWSGRVGYLEGWYVAPGWRRRGVGAALLRAGEAWAAAQGCTEFASDAEPENAISLAAHTALGFEEVGRMVCLRKSL